MGRITKLLALVCILVMNHQITVRTDEFEYKLIDDLLKEYNPLPRPSRNHNEPINISIRMSLNKIFDIFWTDPKLSWDPEKYDGIDLIHLPLEKIWRPDIVLNNAVDECSYNPSSLVQITSKGFCRWYPNGRFRSSCSIRIKDFPFDRQTCVLEFLSSSYNCNELDFEMKDNSSEYTVLTDYKNSSEWDIESFIVKKDSQLCPFYRSLIFQLVLKRKPMFYVMNMMAPCVVTLAVALLAFVTPSASGEKMSISITVLVSTSVLLLVLSNELPPSSEEIPLIGIFYAVSNIFILLISIASAFVLNIHHYGEIGKDVPKIVKKIFFSTFGMIIMFPASFSFEDENVSKNIKMNKKKLSIVERKEDINKNLENTDGPNSLKDDRTAIKENWEILGLIIDRLFLYLFTILIIITLSLIFS